MEKDNNIKSFAIGKGKVSGYASIFLSCLALFAVFCFKYAEWLTTPQFREIYTGAAMKKVMLSVMILSFLFAVISFMLSQKKHWALYSVLISTCTIVLGGFQVQGRDVGDTKYHLGLDWLLLDLLSMAVIFVPIKKV
jgi:hypothetical protein